MKNDTAMQELAIAARFEAGKPADPTENMSPEDAAKWKDMNEEHRDKFKTAAGLSMDGLLDYMFNGFEHEPSESSAVQQLVSWGVKPKFAHDLVTAWWANPPSLASRSLIGQQQYAEDLVREVAKKNNVHLSHDKASILDRTQYPMMHQVPGAPLVNNRINGALLDSYPDGTIITIGTTDFSKDAGKWFHGNQRINKTILIDLVNKLGRKFTVSKMASAHENLMLGLSKMAVGDIPADVERYVKEVKESNPDYDDAQVWATAWSIYCKHGNPGSEHCHMDTNDYFKGAMESLTKLAGTYQEYLMNTKNEKPLSHADWDKKQKDKAHNQRQRDLLLGKKAARTLSDIAIEIRQDWVKPYFGAMPYLQAMGGMDSIDDNYGMDSGSSIVAYFLANASGWKGDKAKAIKKELQDMLKKSRKYANDPDLQSLVVACGGILAEGCPDNLDDAECKTWEANTEKYRDVVKDQHQAGLVNDPVMSEPDNSMRKNPLDPMATWEEGEIDLKDDPREHPSEGSMIPGLEDRLAAEAKMALESKMALDSMMAELEMLAEGCPDNLDDAECQEWESNTDKYRDVVKDQHKSASDILKAIKPGDRVTIVNRFGQESTGRATMRGPAGWVLNMGGAHGTPAIATDDNIVKVVPGKRNTYLATDEGDAKEGKFEEGKPTDPTKNMSPEDAAEWKKQNEEHKDNFKSAKKDKTDKIQWNTWELGVTVTDNKKKREFTVDHYDDGAFEDKATYKKVSDAFRDFLKKLPDMDYVQAFNAAQDLFDEGAKWKTKAKSPSFNLSYGKLASLEEAWNTKLAAVEPTGLYGYTRAIQSSCESSIRKMAKVATQLAKEAYRKDENVAPFLAAHAKRGGSLSAKILVEAMKTLGPKVASEMRKAELKADAIPADKLTKAAARKYGLYGYAAKTASLGLQACTTLRETAGHVTSEMHGRKADSHKLITGFLSAHAKEAKCMYSKMLCASYPDADRKTASVVAPTTVGEWLSWED